MDIKIRVLRTLCNQMGLSCRDQNGKYLPRKKLEEQISVFQSGGGMSPKKVLERYGSELIQTLKRDRVVTQQVAEIQALPDIFVPLDPKFKKYIEWVVQSYINGGIRYEDISTRIWSALEDYSVLLRKGVLNQGRPDQPWTDETNILNFCGLTGCAVKGRVKLGLSGLLERHADVLEKIKEELVVAATAAIKPVFDGPTIRVYQPKTIEQSCRYGQSTKWCTAATKSDNLFECYNEQGPLYIMIPKYPIHPNEKYQLHFETDEYMDQDDEPILLSLLFETFPDFRDFMTMIHPGRHVIDGGVEIWYSEHPDTLRGTVILAGNKAYLSTYYDEIMHHDEYTDTETLYDQYPSLNRLIGPEYRYGLVKYRWKQGLVLVSTRNVDRLVLVLPDGAAYTLHKDGLAHAGGPFGNIVNILNILEQHVRSGNIVRSVGNIERDYFIPLLKRTGRLDTDI